MAKVNPLAPPDGFIQPVADKRVIAAFKPLEEQAIQAILQQDRKDNIAKKNRIEIRWPLAGKSKSKLLIPSGITKGFATGDPQTLSYTAEQILIWMYMQGYSKFYPAMIYKFRKGVVKSLTEIEKSVNMSDYGL